MGRRNDAARRKVRNSASRRARASWLPPEDRGEDSHDRGRRTRTAPVVIGLCGKRVLTVEQANTALSDARTSRLTEAHSRRREVRAYPCRRCSTGAGGDTAWHLTSHVLSHALAEKMFDPDHNLVYAQHRGRAAAVCTCGEQSLYLMDDDRTRRGWLTQHIKQIRDAAEAAQADELAAPGEAGEPRETGT